MYEFEFILSKSSIFIKIIILRYYICCFFSQVSNYLLSYFAPKIAISQVRNAREFVADAFKKFLRAWMQIETVTVRTYFSHRVERSRAVHI